MLFGLVLASGIGSVVTTAVRLSQSVTVVVRLKILDLSQGCIEGARVRAKLLYVGTSPELQSASREDVITVGANALTR